MILNFHTYYSVLFSTCLKEFFSPDCSKVSYVTHVYENDGKRSTARNHSCPAGLLSVDGKIFEKLPNNRFVNHIKKCGPKFHYVSGLLNQLQIFYQMHLIQLVELLIGLGLLSLLHLIYPRISLVFLTNSSLMERFCKNTQLKLELLKGPFLGLIFSDYILMTFLIMLSLIMLLSMLMILLSTLSVIRYEIFGNN